MTLDEIKELAGHRAVPAWVIKLVQECITKELENISEEELDEDEDDVVHYILIEEDSHGNLTWDSSYETLDEFMEVMHIVAEEVQQPVTIVVPIH
mgnify:CR=1 FL=1